MSELMNPKQEQANFRWQLLATVSGLALIASMSVPDDSVAASSANPTVWIELGGQLSRLDEGQEVFAPELLSSRPSMFLPSGNFEHLPRYSVDGLGSVTFQGEHSSWIFAASVRYGKSPSNKDVHQQTYPSPYFFDTTLNFKRPHVAKFADTSVRNSEHHLILDFEAGKDLGLGIFGMGSGTSIFKAGVRFAQFETRSNIALKSIPEWQGEFKYFGAYKLLRGEAFYSNQADLTASRSFHGLGPSISWNSSASIIGDPADSEVALDWGINASLLFGRQKTRTHHQTTGRYQFNNFSGFPTTRVAVYGPYHADPARTRSVIVPNIGGFAGISLKYPNAKVSFGYRADWFFGAMDGGIDARKVEDVGFHGPFATVSIGLGG